VCEGVKFPCSSFFIMEEKENIQIVLVSKTEIEDVADLFLMVRVYTGSMQIREVTMNEERSG